MDEQTANAITNDINQAKALHDHVANDIAFNQTGTPPPIPVEQILSDMNDCLGLLISAVDTLTSVVAEVESQAERKMTDAEIFDAWYRETLRRWP